MSYFPNSKKSTGSSFTQNGPRRFSLDAQPSLSPPPFRPAHGLDADFDSKFDIPRVASPQSVAAQESRQRINAVRPQFGLSAAQEQAIFADKSRRLLNIIRDTRNILSDLRETNRNRFLVHYPLVAPNSSTSNPSTSRKPLSRSSSFSPQNDTLGHPKPPSPAPRDMLRRGFSTNNFPITAPTIGEPVEVPETPSLLSAETSRAFNQQLNVLRLDMRSGPNALTDIAHLEDRTISYLLDEQINNSVKHLNNLETRVSDTSSKVLVTGDLNAGKSTFVNALLQRGVLPIDQQPTTSVFCEVLDADAENDGVEEVHGIRGGSQYKRTNTASYDRLELRHLYKYAVEGPEEGNPYTHLKIYTRDRRRLEESLLHNGVVDIALIDSPGLNTDSIKTTAVFARQEEIDVVVFVVSAENHFTLSGKEFLWNAANEKAHIFIVVNRFDAIRDKERCKRLILEQIRQLSPRTYEDAENLVHFVSAGSVGMEEMDFDEEGPGDEVEQEEEEGEEEEYEESTDVKGKGKAKMTTRKKGKANGHTGRTVDVPVEFGRLERSLRAFVLENRTKSKLNPAKHYVRNVLNDVQVLGESNQAKAKDSLKDANDLLEEQRPTYERLLNAQTEMLEEVEQMAEDAVHAIETSTGDHLTDMVDHLNDAFRGLEYPGLFLIWQYAQDVVDSMVQMVVGGVRECEERAAEETLATAEDMEETGREYLEGPVNGFAHAESSGTSGSANGGSGTPAHQEGDDQSLVPNIDVDVMFPVTQKTSNALTRPLHIQVEPLDFFDFDLQERLSVMSVSTAGLTMIAGRWLNVRNVMGGLWDVSGVLGQSSSRRWMVPAMSIAGLGLVAFMLSDMRRAVERKLYKKMRRQLDEASYVDVQSYRIARQSRKQLRRVGYALQNRIHRALEGCEQQREEWVHRVQVSEEALEFFSNVLKKVEQLKGDVQNVVVEERRVTPSELD